MHPQVQTVPQISNGICVLLYLPHLLLRATVCPDQQDDAEQCKEDVECQQEDEAALDFDVDMGSFEEDGNQGGQIDNGGDEQGELRAGIREAEEPSFVQHPAQEEDLHPQNYRNNKSHLHAPFNVLLSSLPPIPYSNNTPSPLSPLAPISLIFPSNRDKYNSKMNQRATHFNLGNNSQPYSSIYHKDYNPKQADPAPANANNPFRSSSLGVVEKGSFATTNKTLLRAWDNVEKAKLDDQKLHQLKTHHFKLGSYSPNDVLTTNKIYHDRKPISGEASLNQEESKNKMRAHYHDFKEQGFTNYKSTYANQYQTKEADYSSNKPAVHSHPENAICFGNNHLPMVTTSNASFTPKQQQPDNRPSGEPTLGIHLGDKSEPMQTMNQLYFDRKQPSKNSLPESTMKELRNTHFNLGLMPQQYRTENDYYKKTHQAKESQGPTKLTYEIPSYDSGTWVDKQAKFYASTTNKQELPAREVKPFERAVQVTRSGMDFGGHANNYASEFKQNFASPQNPVLSIAEPNKKSNVVIGGEGNYYSTEQKSSYKARDLNAGRVNVDIKKLSREDHFHIGGSTVEPKLTIYQDEHRPDVENRNKLFHREK